jgi:hypothetical protein
MEQDNKKGNIGQHIDFGARGLDTHNTKFYGIDPLAAKYPHLSPYAFVANSPIRFVDTDGKRIEATGTATGEMEEKLLPMLQDNFKNLKFSYSNEGKTLLVTTNSDKPLTAAEQRIFDIARAPEVIHLEFVSGGENDSSPDAFQENKSTVYLGGLMNLGNKTPDNPYWNAPDLFVHILEERWSADVTNKGYKPKDEFDTGFEIFHVDTLQKGVNLIGYQYVNQTEDGVGELYLRDFDIVDNNNEYKGTIRFTKSLINTSQPVQKTLYNRTLPANGLGSITNYQYGIHNVPLENGSTVESDYTKKHFEANPPTQQNSSTKQ